MESGNLNFLEPSGPLQARNGTALPLPLPLPYSFLLEAESTARLEGLSQWKITMIPTRLEPATWSNRATVRPENTYNYVHIFTCLSYISTNRLKMLWRSPSASLGKGVKAFSHFVFVHGNQNYVAGLTLSASHGLTWTGKIRRYGILGRFESIYNHDVTFQKTAITQAVNLLTAM